ncbi:MAG: hypothetical protein Q9216_004527 [Gyalolechia sp. 2 TL-2023]
MVRPSKIARKARRAHKRQHEDLRKQQQLPISEYCHLCSATKPREIKKAIGESHGPSSQPQAPQRFRRSKLPHFLKRNRFPAGILVALSHVSQAQTANDPEFGTERDRSVYWADASRRGDGDFSCGIGVAHQYTTETWVELSWSIRASTDVSVLEIYAIAKALEVAGERCLNMEPEHRPKGLLRKIPYGEELVGPGLHAAEKLDTLKVAVELRWVPSHAGILGNEKADHAAKRGQRNVERQELLKIEIPGLETPQLQQYSRKLSALLDRWYRDSDRNMCEEKDEAW